MEPVMYNTLASPYLVLDAPFTVWEAIKMALLIWTVPLRIMLWVMAGLTVATLNSIAISGCDLSKPLPRWRRKMVELSSSTLSGCMLRCAGFWFPRVMGYDNLEQGRRLGAIGIFNHVSYMDAFVVVWAFVAAGVTMQFTLNIPILGPGIKALQNLYLPKDGSKEKQQSSMVEAIRARAADRRMPMLYVAPEGTLSNGRCLLTFKTGAFVAGMPVVPILLRYRLKPHNPAWTIITPGWHALRLLCQFSNDLLVEILPPYVPSADEKANPALYASNIRKLMARQLNVPLVDEDRSYLLALEKAGVGVSWDGRRVVAPPGVVKEDGWMDLAPYLAQVRGNGRGTPGSAADLASMTNGVAAIGKAA